MCFKTKNHNRVYPLDNCVICLSPTIKYAGCTRCKECGICKLCFQKLIKSGHNRCPVCNLECCKCKRCETHTVCDWATSSDTTFVSVIDVCPVPDTVRPLNTQTNPPGFRESVRGVMLLIGRSILITITCIVIGCIILGLVILVGIFVQSIINPDPPNISSVEYIFINGLIGISVKATQPVAATST